MTENTAEEQLTVEDILEDAPNVQPNSILKVWQEVIKGSQVVRKERVNPQWAQRVTSEYRQVFYQDMNDYASLFYDKIDQLLEVLDTEVETDDQCLEFNTPAEDLDHNFTHYVNVIFAWQKVILSWELNWDCSDPDAAIELAAIIEVHKMFFGDVGLVALLDQINFEFPEDLQVQLFTEMEELKQNWNTDD